MVSVSNRFWRVGRRTMRSHVALLALIALAMLACPRPVEVSGPPNVVLISVDTLRADFLNAYGFDEHRVSPAIDRLAADGILFEQHIAASPWTTPSHMSLFTSLAPTSHGVNESFSSLRSGLRRGTHKKLADARTTLAEVLQRAGYATAAFTGGITLIPQIGFDQGFDRFETSMYKLDDANVQVMALESRAGTTTRTWARCSGGSKITPTRPSSCSSTPSRCTHPSCTPICSTTRTRGSPLGSVRWRPSSWTPRVT